MKAAAAIAALALLAACGACSDPGGELEAPDLVVVTDLEAWTEDELAALERGANTWGELGAAGELVDVAGDFTAAAPSCPRLWYQREPRELDCAIYVRLEREVLEDRVGYAVRELRLVVLEQRLQPLSLQLALGHELGHILLDTEEHAAGDAVMRYTRPAPAPTALDLELACRQIGACP